MVSGWPVHRVFIRTGWSRQDLHHGGRWKLASLRQRLRRGVVYAVLGTMKRDLLSIHDLSPQEIESLLFNAAQLKKSPMRPGVLKGKTVALVFEKPSTRTLISF